MPKIVGWDKAKKTIGIQITPAACPIGPLTGGKGKTA